MNIRWGYPALSEKDYSNWPYSEHDITQAWVQDQFTWAVLILAFLTADVALIQELGPVWESAFYFLTATAYVVLTVALCYSFRRFLYISLDVARWYIWTMSSVPAEIIKRRLEEAPPPKWSALLFENVTEKDWRRIKINEGRARIVYILVIGLPILILLSKVL